METVIVGCKTLENELLRAVEETGCSYEILWIESGLHNYPKKLNQVLQETLDGCGARQVLAAMGFCGNSIENISTGDYTLIFPRVDDCISLLLGSCKRRMEISRAFYMPCSPSFLACIPTRRTRKNSWRR